MGSSPQTIEFDLGDPRPHLAELGGASFDSLPHLPALSVRQPWAVSILNGKPVENRSWRGSFLEDQLAILRAAGNRFLLHASKCMEEDDVEGWRELIEVRNIPVPWAVGLKLSQLHRGGIIGIATFAGWVTEHESPWFNGGGAMEMKDVRPLPFVPCRGALGFFFPFR